MDFECPGPGEECHPVTQCSVTIVLQKYVEIMNIKLLVFALSNDTGTVCRKLFLPNQVISLSFIHDPIRTSEKFISGFLSRSRHIMCHCYHPVSLQSTPTEGLAVSQISRIPWLRPYTLECTLLAPTTSPLLLPILEDSRDTSTLSLCDCGSNAHSMGECVLLILVSPDPNTGPPRG